MHLYACSVTTVVIQIPISHVLFFLVTRSVHNYLYGLAWLIHHISKRQLINLSIYLNFLPLRVLPLLSPCPSSFFPSQIHPRISETFVMVLLKIFLDSTKLKIVWTKITTFFKRRVSIIL